MKEKKGLFITFEGIEGCGKSTQSKMLRDYLESCGKSVLLTREPGGPLISEKIRSLLLDPENSEMLRETELLLYMASRSQHTGQWIIPALEEGKYVISDRYNDSSIAYQGAARKLDLSQIDGITRFATFSLVPDITFLIDLPAENGLCRIQPCVADRIEQEDIEFHKRVRQGFLDVANREPGRFCIIDGRGTIEEIHVEIIRKMDILLETE